MDIGRSAFLVSVPGERSWENAASLPPLSVDEAGGPGEDEAGDQAYEAVKCG